VLFGEFHIVRKREISNAYFTAPEAVAVTSLWLAAGLISKQLPLQVEWVAI
jgi:hypothetical protein